MHDLAPWRLLLADRETTSTRLNELPAREQIDPKYRWRLEDIYPSDDDWETDYRRVEQGLGAIGEFKGRTGESAEALLKVLKLRDELEERFERVFVYAAMRSDEDTTNEHYQALRDRAASLAARVQEATAFVSTEILDIPEEKLWQWVEENEDLRVYRHFLEDLLRTREHVLPREQEELLARTSEVARAPHDIFNMFNNADIRFSKILDERGNEIEVTKGRYALLQESPDRRVRRDAFRALYGEYSKWPNTLASMLNGSVKKDVFYARTRRYPSALRMALDADNVPDEVYSNLIDAVHAGLEPLHRAISLRKRALKVEAVHPYDLYVPLVPSLKWEVPYEEARELVLGALSILGEEYGEQLKRAFREGWIDVFENRGKRTGAYSWGAYGVHPYILLNYNGRLDDVFTLAHELGHAMHSHFTWSTQPYIYGDYSIFVAEVASTVNEALLTHYLLGRTEEPQRRLYLLNHWVDQIRGTVYTQVLFAEFEKATHEMVERGQPLTANVLNKLASNLYRTYLGPDFTLDSPYEINWARIPHFYTAFYVYKYATGYSAATAISQKILSGEAGAVERYLDFLRSGSSDYPLNLLRKAGVDMRSPEPVRSVTGLLARLVSEMEGLIGS